MTRAPWYLLSALSLAVISAPELAAHEKMVEVFGVPRDVETTLERMPANNEAVTLFFAVDDHTVPDMDSSPDVGLYLRAVGVALRRITEDIDLGRADLRMESGASTSRVKMTSLLVGALPGDAACAGTYDEGTRIRTHECTSMVELVVDVSQPVGTSSQAAVDENTYSLSTGQQVTLAVTRRECDESVSPEVCQAVPVWQGSFQVLASRVVAATPVETVTWGSLKSRYGRD